MIMNAPESDNIPIENDEPSQPADGGDAEASAPEVSAADQLRAAVEERDQWHERALRSQAELENVRRRLLKEAEQLRQYASAPLATDLLPCLDNLQRAIENAEKTGSIEDLLQGLRMVAGSFEETFARHGVVPIPTAGEAFDPNLHEALQQVPSSEHGAMEIVQEVERGWQLHDRVLRPSKVIVSSGPPAADPPAAE